MDSTCTAEYPLKHPPCGPPANPADRNVVDRQGGVFPPAMSLLGAMVNHLVVSLYPADGPCSRSITWKR